MPLVRICAGGDQQWSSLPRPRTFAIADLGLCWVRVRENSSLCHHICGVIGGSMDLRQFYQKLRTIEREIADPHVLVVSHETPDGGKAGQKAEVSRSIAAKLIVEGRARLAGAEEIAEYRAALEQALHDADQRAMAQKIQVNVVSEADFRAIKGAPRPEKR